MCNTVHPSVPRGEVSLDVRSASDTACTTSRSSTHSGSNGWPRSNDPNPGRHSLETKDLTEALDAARQLDLVKAVELHLADPAVLADSPDVRLRLGEGIQLYRDNILSGRRPPR
jgi:hypothetical protein